MIKDDKLNGYTFGIAKKFIGKQIVICNDLVFMLKVDNIIIISFCFDRTRALTWTKVQIT